MSFSIRTLTPDDAKAMRALRLMGLQTDAYAFGASYETESQEPLSFFESRCTPNDTNAFLGAFQDQQLVALTSIVRETAPKYRHHAGIYAVYTHPDFRGQGLSRGLLEKAIAITKSWDGVEYLQLGVATTNVAAIHLYESVGFKTWGTQESALRVDGVDYDEHYMALKLRG
jgi:ribosomal protein S18 acetylase RimI-like enzyme